MNKPFSNKYFRLTLVLLVFLMLCARPGLVRAQDADPPSRVARLNFIDGQVSFQPAGAPDWLDANPNRPLTTGDQLWADQSSRGELHMGGSVLRISAQTGISFLNLSDQAVQIQVAQGSAMLRVLHLEDNENYEIDTPNLALTILRPGEYRIDVNADGASSGVTVLNGAGEVTAGGAAYNVSPGQQYIFSGTDQVSYNAGALAAPDDFQRWNLDRDRREDRMASARYVSRDVIGYEDLDDHGTWRDDPTYGHVWYPTGVAVGWAPYHYGHWAFIAPWGWTWVEDEPWGFAPFHYGRWAVVGGAWGWVPGPPPVVGAVYVRAVYAPALVAFVGGGGFAASIEIGGGGGVGIAWFPLGPRDVWVPSYHVSAVYMTNVNVTNSRVINRTEVTSVYNTTIINNNTTVNVNRTYMYQNAPGAVTAVPRASFQNGEPVARASVEVNAQQIQHPHVMQATAIAPTPRAVAGPNVLARPSARPPATLASRPVVTKMAPSPRAIPVGLSKPASASTYHSMAAAKPATTPPPGRTAVPPPGTPTGRPMGAPAGAPPVEQPGRQAMAPPAAGKPAPTEGSGIRSNEGPGNTSAVPPKSQPPTRENQPPIRTNEGPGNTSAVPPRFQPPARENQPPARTNDVPVNKPATPNVPQPPPHEVQPTPVPRPTPPPPAREVQPTPAPRPAPTPQPEVKAAPHQPEPPPKKPNPPKDPKDKDKDQQH